MPQVEPSYARWEAAGEAEKKAWAKVKDHLPGSAGYDAAAWEEWRAAVAASDEARKLMLAAIDVRAAKASEA